MNAQDFAKDWHREASNQPGMILEVIALEAELMTKPKAA